MTGYGLMQVIFARRWLATSALSFRLETGDVDIAITGRQIVKQENYSYLNSVIK